MSTEQKRIAVIGAGIGGLTAGIYAAKNGFEVDLYEQQGVAGGECTGWDREGFYIDNCIHWMMGTRPGSALNRIWRTTGMLAEDTQVYRADQMYTSEYDGETLTLWADIDRTEREMIAHSPADKKEIRRLMKYCRLAEDITIPAEVPSELMSGKEGLALTGTGIKMMRIQNAYKNMNVADLAALFKSPLIGRLISDFTPGDSVASGFVTAYGNFTGGDGGVPIGGSKAAAGRMLAKFEKAGGRYHPGTKVGKILPAGGRASGILLENGEEIQYDYIIPACDASVTFGTLLPESFMGALMKSMFADRKAYPVYNTFQTAFEVDMAEEPFDAEYNFESPELVFHEGAGPRLTVKTYGYEPDFAPAGKQILETLGGGSESLYPWWQELYQDREAYEAKKTEIAETTRIVLEDHFPKLKGKLRLLDAWTPMTYARYCSAYKGFYQAFMISKDSAKLPYPPAYVDGLDNVILAGQWISPPGGLPGAAITGKAAVQRIMNKEQMDFRLADAGFAG